MDNESELVLKNELQWLGLVQDDDVLERLAKVLLRRTVRNFIERELDLNRIFEELEQESDGRYLILEDSEVFEDSWLKVMHERERGRHER